MDSLLTDAQILSDYWEAIVIANANGDMQGVYVYSRMLTKAFHRYCF